MNNKSKKEKNKSNNNINIIIISIILIALLSLIIILLPKKSSSEIKNKETIKSYLEETFDSDDFEIISEKKLSEKICNSTGYKWSVKSNKSGVSFEVYEGEAFNRSTGECARIIEDNYEEKTPDVFYENEKLESDNKYHYIFDPNDYKSKEELANKIYNLIDKYYLKNKSYAVRLIIKIEDTNVAVDPDDINSPEDVINKFLSE